MTALPAPLVPPECTMAGNDWFPLYFQRLRKSKWWRRASDMARARNVMLWGEAYQGAPAGSLPDDDDDLAEAAGFGMDVEAFLAAKAEILAPWVLCSDGRWYHPTTCEVVLEAWGEIGERRKKAAAKKAAQRAKVREIAPPPRGVPQKTTVVPRDTLENAPLSPPIPAQTEQTEQTEEDANASLSTEAVDDATPESYPDLFETAWKAYPHVRGRSSKHKALGIWRRLSKAYRDQLPAAASRFAREGREPKAECGAPGMHRWLADRKFLDWLTSTAVPEPVVRDEASTWRSRLRQFTGPSQHWNTMDWGPKPGKPGCRAPPDLLSEFGFSPATGLPAVEVSFAAPQPTA